MPRVCTKNEVDVVSTTCGALLFCILHCQNGALRVFTNECAPRHHHDGGTTSLHHHSFDHILRCTGPIFSKLKPLERTRQTKIKIYFNGYRKEPPHLHWDIVRLAAYGIIGKDSVSDFGLSVICSCVFWRKETTKRFHPNYFLEDICTGCIFCMLGSVWSRLCHLFSYLLVFESSLY